MGVVKECKFVFVRKAHKILLGRDIVSKFNISVNNEGVRINEMWAENMNYKVKSSLSKYSHLFKRDAYQGEKIKLTIEPSASPIFRKPHPIPFAFWEKVVNELSKLENEGVTTKVANSSWGTPILSVMKPNGKDIRLCANYKINIILLINI